MDSPTHDKASFTKFLDRNLEGYTIQEIARILKISPSRLSRKLGQIGGRTGQMNLFAHTR